MDNTPMPGHDDEIRPIPEELTAELPLPLDDTSMPEYPTSELQEVPALDSKEQADSLSESIINELEMDTNPPADAFPILTDNDPANPEETIHEEEIPPNEESTDKPYTLQKGRPRRKKGEGFLGIPNILTTIVWAAVTLAVGITLGRLLWVCATDVLAFGKQDRAVTVTVYETDTVDDIVDKLYDAKLIRYPGLFRFYAKFAVDEGEIKPGMWDLNTMYDYHALVKMMSPSSSKEVVKVMIPEGYSCRQIFELLQDSKVCTIQDIASYAANGELDEYWFLEDVERGDKYCLEGFLFPDTYEFYKNDSPATVLNKMLRNFDNRFDEELQAMIPELNDRISDMMRRDGHGAEYIEKHQFTVRDILTLASMVEKETASAEEAYTIASVIYNRLFAWGNTPSYLNIDATIVYALEGKTDLTVDDLQVDSPYNTYFNVGLTPGPIANPGLSSIMAALEPAETSYYFYVLDPSTMSHHFSRTLEEHEAFRASLGG